ncbi:hypothetical protein [Variovorax sp. E3]|uniref:hypothetical protein n=1 Tax=Variovorax sp. E3 TaxID=1914993 RepID=UPI0018DDD603|nr:hypothetical protein [Variovorax sp. E3]
MKPGICKKHGGQNFALTSSDLVAAINEGKMLSSSDVCKITTSSFGRKSETFVGKGFFRRFFEDPGVSEVSLLDREKDLKKMNDRLLIRKIFSDPDLKFVCAVCLREIIGQWD